MRLVVVFIGLRFRFIGIRTTEKTTGTNNYFFLRLLNNSWGGLGGGSSNWGSSSSEERWVSKDVGDTLDSWDADKVEFDTSTKDALGSLLEDVWNGWETGVVEAEGYRGEVRKTLIEVLLHNFIIDSKDRSIIDLTVIIDTVDLDLVVEWLDFKLLKECSLRCSNDITLLDKLDWLSDFDLTLVNLSGDTKGSEELVLVWAHVGKHWLNDDIAWSDGTVLGSSATAGLSEGIKNYFAIAVGEDKTDTVVEVGDKFMDMGISMHLVVDDVADDGVLAEDKSGLAAEETTAIIDLTRTDVGVVDQ